MQRARLPYILIPVAAFIAILPLLIHRCSCGHDFDFHLLNWFEAAHQFTHGNLHPHWAYTPAYNAGEPRFVFYPPISWIIGSILGLLFPWSWTPILYTWLALTAAGLSLHYLARDFTTPAAATLAAVLYTVNPYMLFTAYERTAYSELLAAAWIPLLLHAILQKEISIPRIAIPVALLWLTNAPAAVMSCYALALLTLIRVFIPGANSGAPFMQSHRMSGPSCEARSAPAHLNPATAPSQTRLHIAANTITGTILGLGIAAFYIIPAAYERRFVQIAMAIIPFYRIQDNFLFHQTGDLDHDKVLHAASLIAVTLIAATAIVLTILREAKKARVPHPSQSYREGWDQRTSPSRSPFLPLTILTIAITLLQTPITSFIWTHAPELAFLQFPWRLLAILASVLALAVAIALTPLRINPTKTAILTLLIATTLTYPAYQTFHQTCDPEDTVKARLALFHSNEGTDPTDEYTPTTADNDALAHNNPPYWLAPNPEDNASATTPINQRTENSGNANTKPGPAPTHFEVTQPSPAYLIVNLRDYPAWHITRNGSPITTRAKRPDGLIAIPIPAGLSIIDITYTSSADQTIGIIITLLSLATITKLLLTTNN